MTMTSTRVLMSWAGISLRSKAKKILAGLSFRESDFDRPAKEMSGGWVMRAHLARLLVQEPDLLMLDEPTNHLDLEALLWFQEYLKQYSGAILMISHDREFLNQLVGSIIEIRQSQLVRYRGNYEDYVVQRAAAEEQQAAAYKNQQREIAHLMEFVDRFRAKNTKAAQAQSKLKQIERMEKIEAPVSDEKKKIRISVFRSHNGSGLKVITLEGQFHHAYGANVVYHGIDYLAERDQRVVLVGPNGAGKSTLLKILAGVLPAQGGVRELGHNVKAGYYSQYRVDMLPTATHCAGGGDWIPHRNWITRQFVRTVLGSFLFRGDDVFKRVSVLSGGEKSRLALVKLLLDPPNLLLMDEPTTHLDMASIIVDALVGALKQFAGTLIFISHDVYFYPRAGESCGACECRQIDALFGRLSVLSRQDLRHFSAGGTDRRSEGGGSARQSRRKTECKVEGTKAVGSGAAPGAVAGAEGPAAIGAPVGEGDQRAGVEADGIDGGIGEAGNLSTGRPRVMEINRELIYVQERLAELTPEWEAASVKLEEVEG